MMDCCQETASIRSNNRQQLYQDLETILNNLPSYQNQQPLTSLHKNAPKMNISLDLPGYDEYLPTYWPGQKITGEVKIQLQNNTPIKVTHLRIALFGNVQVYGNHPGHPMTNGLFDYQKNEQLINTGLRIVRRSASSHQQQQVPITHPSTIDDESRVVPPLSPSLSPSPTPVQVPTTAQQQQDNNRRISASNDDNSSAVIEDERRWKLCCRRDERGSAEVGPLDLQQSNNKKSANKRKKTPEDRHIERLIRRVAAIGHTSTVCSGLLNDPIPSNNYDEAFELNTNTSTTNTIAFSIRVPTSRRLAGSFDHPHHPISYRVVAIMKCREGENNEVTCYSTVRLCLESCIDIHAPQFNSRIQSNPTRQYVQNNNSLLSGVCTFALSSSSVLTYWLQKFSPQNQRKITPSSNYCSSFLQCYLELPKQAFERSQYIPLKLNFENHAAPHFKISAIKIYVEFVRRINMTCSINEELEGKALQSATVVFKSSEEEQEMNSADDDDLVFFKHANMCFDLSKLIQVPENCTCTISSESTKDIFSLSYDLIVRLDVSGVTQSKDNSNLRASMTLQEDESEPYQYYASGKHLIQQEQQQQDNMPIPKEPYHHKFKTYTLHLDPLTVVIGRSGYQNNSNNNLIS